MAGMFIRSTKKKNETTRVISVCVLCASLIISPANGHHVAGCFAVDWMKLIKLEGRGGRKGIVARLEVAGKGVGGAGGAERARCLRRVDTCSMLHAPRMRSEAYHRPYAKLAAICSLFVYSYIVPIKVSNRAAHIELPSLRV